MDLFRFMESFQDGSGRRVGAQGDNLVVPADCLDRCAFSLLLVSCLRAEER
jgi:hypothetical protein